MERRYSPDYIAKLFGVTKGTVIAWCVDGHHASGHGRFFPFSVRELRGCGIRTAPGGVSRVMSRGNCDDERNGWKRE